MLAFLGYRSKISSLPLGIENEWLEDYEEFIENQEDKLIYGLEGTAKSMLGWCTLPKN